MKNLFLIVALVAIASCNKPSKEKMNAEELKVKHGIVLPDLEYEGDEIETASPNSNKGGKKKANAQVVVVWFNDLTLTESGGTLTTTISDNAQWAGVQKFITIDTTNNAVSVCNWNFATPPGPGTTKTCQSNGPGFYRSWTSDFDYNVHVSPFVTLE